MDGIPAGTASESPLASPLVSPQWLAAHLEDPGLRILDARWLLGCLHGSEFTVDDRDGYQAGHIPGAQFVGMQSELSDSDHPVQDMLAPPEQFALVMGRLGIGDGTLVVTYDDMGVPLASARLWWALSCYGMSGSGCWTVDCGSGELWVTPSAPPCRR
ncbi:hypothetical protein KBY96_15840 [Cyanobium sp. ATX 6A2]|uniref:rhodanese-like domain-containing protein n=1 Tax=Cyanobium sp. ATX 6A2 TaxID=2823700 RepID=UPI0020CC55CA|nr:rhodanese-like domain-containing protein [Cyanobium sp. ATX 6A2]MCP9889387.1 hypothetical protein [Cyanobium sp. ATX 6A2]